MGLTELLAGNTEAMTSGALGAIIGLSIAFAVILGIAVYVYFAFAWMTIAKKQGHKHPWLAWIPFANVALIFQLGGFHWALVFLLLVPFLGAAAVGVIAIIATWRIYVKRNYPGWLALIPLAGLIPFLAFFAQLAGLIILGFVAWKDKGKKKKK